MNNLTIDPERDLLAGAGGGMGLFRRHFTTFRPLVTATALGTAAGVHTTVTDALAARTRLGVLPQVRDNALITLGRTYAELCAALLATVATPAWPPPQSPTRTCGRGSARHTVWTPPTRR